MAEHLALWYIEQGFKFYDIENSINEAESIFKKDEKQNIFSDEYVTDLCESNEIYFLENGIEYGKIESSLKGLI